MTEKYNPFLSLFIGNKDFFRSQVDVNREKVLSDGEAVVLARAATYVDVMFKTNADRVLVAKASRMLMDLEKTDKYVKSQGKYDLYLEEALK